MTENAQGGAGAEGASGSGVAANSTRTRDSRGLLGIRLIS